MNAKTIAVLAMRVVGLFVIVRGLHSLSFALDGWWRTRELEMLINMAGATSLALMAIGLAIWAAAVPLASVALPLPSPDEEDPGEEVVSDRVSALDIHAIAFSVLGFYLVAEGFSRLGQALVTLREFRGVPEMGIADDYFTTQLWTQAATALFLAIAGLVIALGARGLAGFFRRIWFEGRWTVQARRIEIVDPEGRTRAELAVGPLTEGGREDVTLVFFDEESRERLVLGTRRGSPFVDHVDEADAPS